MRVERLTKQLVENAQVLPGAARTIYWEAMTGLGLMVTANGHRSFLFQYRIDGRSRRMNLDGKFLRLEAEREAKSSGKARPPRTSVSPLDAARREAVKVHNAVLDGRDPLAECRKAATTSTLRAVAEEYLSRDGKKLRSYEERRRIFERYVYPALASRKVDDIRRLEIVHLLDRIEDESGPVQADAVLAVVRKLFNWHAARVDEFKTPIVKGMSRAAPAKQRARSRILSDHEIRAFWTTADAFPGAFGYLLKFILLTATRLREASNMARQEVSGDVWTIPGRRHKSKQQFELPLSGAAKDLLAAVPQIAGRPGWVFTHDGMRPIGGFSKFKARFDQAMLAELRKDDSEAELEPWVLHDLRRTGRSLMSRAGVPPRHAEMALGHTVAGVEGVYDRHRYLDEKRAAAEALAGQIDRILRPQNNVVELRGAR